MAVKFRRNYTSQAEQIYDLASMSTLFDKEYYASLAAENRGEDYTYAIAGTRNRTSDNFSRMDYNLLNGEDRYNYLLTNYYMDPSSQEYKDNQKYFRGKINEIKDLEIYKNMTDFQKFLTGIVSIGGNALNEMFLGTLEGLIDVSASIVGIFGKDKEKYKQFIAEDTTGYSKNREALFRFTRATTDVDKNSFLTAVNAVTSGLAKLAPTALPGGKVIYFGAMTGNVVEEAVLRNPDIDYGVLLLYSAAVAGVEMATEKISDVFFGGSTIDKVFFGGKAGGGGIKTHWWSRMGMDFASEGLEESVSEFADSVLFKWMVDGDEEIASMGDILYAGLIGGLIGGVSSGISIAKQKPIILGNKKLTKSESLALSENIAQAQHVLNDSAVFNLQLKYPNLSLQELQNQHSEEYKKAVKKDEKRDVRLTESLGALSKLLNLIGPESFTKALGIANRTFQTKEKLLQNYVDIATGTTKINREVEQMFAKKNPGSSIKVNDALSLQQRKFKEGIKKTYGKDVYFVTFGEQNGDIKKYGATLDENTILIDNEYSELASPEKLMGEVVREELSHTLQYTSGILTAKNVSELLKMYHVKTNEKLKGSELSDAYDGSSDLTNISEVQAKAMSDVLLFDELTINNIFSRKVSIFKKVYRWIKNQISAKKKKQDPTSKLQYRELLLAKKRYDNVVAQRIGNKESLEKIMSLDDDDIEYIEDLMNPDYSSGNFIILTADHTEHVANKISADQELSKNRVISEINNEFDYNRAFDPEYYLNDFVEMVMKNNPEDTFENNLQEYLINTYGFAINVSEGCLMEFIDVDTVLSTRGELFIDEPSDKVKTMGDLFTEDFKSKYREYSGKDLDDISLRIVNTKDTPYVEHYPSKGLLDEEFVIYYNPELKTYLKNDMLREFSRFLSLEQGPVNGISTNYVKEALLRGPRNTLLKLAEKTLTKKFYSENINNPEILAENVGYAVYRLSDGVFGDKIEKNNLKRNFDDTVYGFAYDEIGNLIGYGELYGLNIMVPKEFYKERKQYDKNVLGKEAVVTSYSKKTVVDKSIDTKQKTKTSESDVSSKPESGVENKEIKLETPKQKESKTPEYKLSPADDILSATKDAPKEINIIQFGNPKNKEHTVISNNFMEKVYDIVNGRVNSDNYHEVRESLVNSKKPQAKQALIAFDYCCKDMSGTFKTKIKNSIENTYAKNVSLAGQTINVQSRLVEEKRPASAMIENLKNEGFDISVDDALVAEFDAKMRNKDEYIKELEHRIEVLKAEINSFENPVDRLDKTKELKDISDLLNAIRSGNAEEVLDWIITHTEGLEQASKIKDAIFKRLIDKATEASEKDKDVSIRLKNKDGKFIAFPEFKAKIYAGLKKLRAFRMWAMLSSPVTWVKNWVGNTLMKGLDNVTNSVERTINKNIETEKDQVKYNETKAGKELTEHIAKSHQHYIQNDLILGENKYEATPEKAAQHAADVRAKKYEVTNNAFEKLCLKAQDLTHWGLSAGPLGDEPMLFNAIVKNMGNLVASNVDMCLKGIKNEERRLRNKDNLSEAEQTKLKALQDAIKTKDPIKIFDVMNENDTKFFFDIAKEMAFKQYFRNTNALSKWMANIADKSPIMGELMSWVLPFPKVAVNILSMAYRYSPLGFISAISKQSTYKSMKEAGKLKGTEQAEIVRAYSEAAVGTFLVIAGAIAAALGWVDIDDDDYMGPALNLGNVRIGLSNLAPALTTFSTASALVWSWKNNKNAVEHALSTLYDNTLLGTIDNMFASGSIENFGGNAALSYLTQYIPSVLKLVNKAISGGKMKDKSGPWLTKTIKTLGSYIPGVSELVPDKIDPYTGEPRHYVGSPSWFKNLIGALSPVSVKFYDHMSDFQIEAETVGATTKGFNGMFVINGSSYKLQNKTEYAKYRSKYLNKLFDEIYSGNKFVTVEDANGKRLTTKYEKLTREQKVQVLKRLYSESTDLTKVKWWIDNGNYYITGNRDEYTKLRKIIGDSNIKYSSDWSKSKFVKK